jgi:ArsR family transcriptional regulator, arsenate/arsenite/antimonite-responsive transcriptional repressor
LTRVDEIQTKDYTSIMIEVYATRAEQFRAMGDPTRLAILELLSEGSRCVCQIQPALGIAANLLSHHLKILREAGLISSEKIGRLVEYKLEPTALLQLHAAIPTPVKRVLRVQSTLNYTKSMSIAG